MDNLGNNLGTPNMIPDKETKGPMVGIIVIIILLVIGGIYLWQSRTAPEVINITSTSTDPTTQQLGSQSTSVNLEDIEADVNNTNFDDLDAELDEIETELNTQ
jgi:hypothetical protein